MTTEMSVRIGDVLIDELGNRYTMRGVEMIHYLPGYEFLAGIVLSIIIEQSDPSAPVGEYLAPYKG